MMISMLAAGFESSTSNRALFAVTFFAGIFLWRWQLPLPPFAILAGLIFAAIPPVRARIEATENSRWITAAVFSLVTLSALGYTYGRFDPSGRIHAAIISRAETDAEQSMLWARDNTPTDSVFLIDPRQYAFRALSMRPAFMTWMGGASILWQRPFISEWDRRLRAVGLDVRDGTLIGRNIADLLGSKYQALRDSDVLALQSRYPLRYRMVAEDHPTAFPVVYRNKTYKILEISNP